jgi:fructose-specific PTS system IIA-like component
MTEFRFICDLAHGLHARPASLLAEAFRPFAARVELVNESSGKAANARSVLSVVALDVAMGDAVLARAEGDDAEQAMEALRAVINGGLGEAGAFAKSAENARNDAIQARLPAGLLRLNVRTIAGRGISGGVARGPAAVAGLEKSHRKEKSAESIEIEQASVTRAIEAVRDAITQRLDTAGSDLERDLLRAHASIADDPALRDRIYVELDARVTATEAVRRAGAFFKRSLASASSEYIRDRALDIEDVAQQIIAQLTGLDESSIIPLREPSIVVADMLTPRQIMALDCALLRGLVLGRVGATSHTVILARAFGIPALVDVRVGESGLRDGAEIIVDADAGFVLADLSNEVDRYYAIERKAAAKRRQRLEPHVARAGCTRCGSPMEVGANVSTAAETERALSEGAQGIGLFRTEMLFLDRSAPPSEDEQHAEYTRAIAHAAGRPIIFRTFDIGGDKPAPYLRLPAEENPFLGWRGIRLYQRFEQLLHSQLRAVIRASADGPVKIMAPMVSNALEAAWFVERVREVQNELREVGLAFDENVPIGVMIEVPSAALAIERLAEVIDFFSIGTNDLAQYFFAADRANPHVAGLCDPLEPSFVRLLKSIVDAARARGKWVGVCGEMAGDPRNLPIFVGLGVDEVSVSPARVLEIKAALAKLDGGECRRALDQLIASRDAGQVRAALTQFTRHRGGDDQRSISLIDQDLVVIDSESLSKVEAIKELVELIVSAGRASDARALEHAIWAREETYATGVGFGFAIPHCKSDAVHAATIAVARLREPIDWGAADGEPVRLVIMLGIRGEDDAAAKAHMQVLARLARRLMHEEFRDNLNSVTSSEGLVAALTAALSES